MTSGVRVVARVDARHFDVDVHLPAARVTALVGPNGAGKSTLVGLISGELGPDAGTVTISTQTVADGRSFVPPHRRTVALLHQRPLLFPHLNVLENVAFGVRSRGASKAQARRRALAELDAVGAAPFATRPSRQLSGGEAQRVAIARALATDPSVVLLDEPFASLDVATAAALRRLLATRLAASAATVALVTHDPLDLWALADGLIALDGGRVTASGEVADLLGRPRTGFLAHLSGLNLLQGRADADTLVAGGDHVAGLWADDAPSREGHPALATFDPSAVALYAERPHGSPRNTWPVTVTGLDPRGPTVRVLLTLDDSQSLAAELTASGVAALGIVPGDRLIAQVKATQVRLYAR